MPKLRVVIEGERHHAGNGTADDPFRMITTYHTPEGELLAEVDAWGLVLGERIRKEKADLSDFVTFYQTVRDLMQRRVGPLASDDPQELWRRVRDLVVRVTDPPTTATAAPSCVACGHLSLNHRPQEMIGGSCAIPGCGCTKPRESITEIE